MMDFACLRGFDGIRRTAELMTEAFLEEEVLPVRAVSDDKDNPTRSEFCR